MAIANGAKNCCPGNADRTLALERIETAIELGSLSISHRTCFGGGSQALPKLLDELQAIADGKALKIGQWNVHGDIIPD